MLSKEDIIIFFSQAYEKAALREGADMRLIADIFESVRPQISTDDLYDCWDYVIVDYVKFYNDDCIALLTNLKDNYFIFFYEKIINTLSAAYTNNAEEGAALWKQTFAEATVHFKDDLVCMLYVLAAQWKNKSEALIKYAKLPQLMREARWADAFPVYVDLAADTALTNTIRGFAEIALVEIILYHYPETSRAPEHLEKAAALLPGHFIIKRGWAEYYLKTNNTQKARNNFLQVLAIKPGDYFSLNSIGDSFFLDLQLENAESWYNEALHKNFIQTDSYKRLIGLYGDKTWFKEKYPLTENLLSKIEKQLTYKNKNELVEKQLANKDCFKDFTLYECYRSIGAAWFTNGNLQTSAGWYIKAKKLEPAVATAYIDIAYLKIHDNKMAEAEKFFLQALEADADNYDAHWGLAYYYEKENQKEKALSAYEQCLRIRPQWNDWINNFIGNLYFGHKEYSTAESYYRQSFQANPAYTIYKQNIADALQGKADELMNASNFEEAEKNYKAAAEIENDASRWNTLGNFYYNTKQWQQAIDNYNKAISLKDDDPVFYENRGLVFENLNNKTEAEKSYQQSIKYEPDGGRYFNRLGFFYYNQKDYEQAIKYYLKAIELSPEEPIYLENVCIAYEDINEPEKAKPYYLAIIKIQPGNDRILNMLGLLYYKNKEYEKASTYYREAIKVTTENAVYYENLGILYRDMGKTDEAIHAFENALAINAENDTAWNDTGVLYFNLGNYDKAIEDYTKAINLKPNVSLYYENTGLAYESKEQFNEALDFYKKAIEITPGNARLLNVMGLIHYNNNELEQAIDYYKKAIEVDSSNWVYFTNLGLALRLLQRNDEAIEAYKKALQLKDDDYLSQNDLGVLLYQKGETDEAIEHYRKSISLQPDDATLFMNLALALHSIGKSTEALHVTGGYTLTEETKNELDKMMREYLPELFEKK